MNEKTKKIVYWSLFGLDIAITIVLFIISIIMLATFPADGNLDNATGFIGGLQKNPTIFLCAVVVPLFILLGVNILLLYLYVKKYSQKKKVELNDLSATELEALKSELLKDLGNKNEAETAEVKEEKAE